MKQYLGLVFVGLTALACSSSGQTGSDLGNRTRDLGGMNPDLASTDQDLGTTDQDLGGMNQDLGSMNQDLSGQGDLGVSPLNLYLMAGGLGGPGNGDGISPAVRFNGPLSMAVDGAGNMYIADSINKAIRKVVLATGTVTTLVGGLSTPSALALDSAGSLYVADSGNSTIIKVAVANGAITQVAGSAGLLGSADGTGAAARFHGPSGLALDQANGILYVGDTINNTIRKVVLATNAVTTIAGMAGTSGSTDGTGTAALFSRPAGLSLDSAGNLYVVDSANSTIRKMVVSSGVVTTLAGSPLMIGIADGTGSTARFAFPIGAAVDGAGNLFIADTSGYTIRKVVTGSGATTTLAGLGSTPGSVDGTGTAARFNSPRGVAVDGAGNVYVADYNNHTIRKVVIASGVTTTMPGTLPKPGSTDATGNAARFTQPIGVTADGAGNLFIADSGNNTIRKVVAATGATTTLAGSAGVAGSVDGTGTAAQFFSPSGVTADGAGNLFVADTTSRTIRKVVIASRVVTTLAGSAGVAGSVDGTGTAAQFNLPTGIVTDGAGNLFVTDFGSNTIRKVVIASRVVTTLAGTAGMFGSTDATGAAARFSSPYGVAWDGAGNLFVADSANQTIRKVVASSGVVTTLAGTAGMTGSTDGTGTAARFNQPQGVAVDGSGNLYVADFGNSTIRKIVLASSAVTTWVGVAGQRLTLPGPLPASLNRPAGIAALSSGTLYLTDFAENAVLEVR